MKLLRIFTAFLLSAALLLSGCRAVVPEKSGDTAAVTPVRKGIPLYGDVTETDLLGDLLQVVQWQSGLDTASGDIFLYDLSTDVVLGQMALPSDAWATGCLTDGMYTVSLSSGTVTLYDTACTPRATWPLHASFAFAAVSADGEWLLYGDGPTATVHLRRLKTGEDRIITTFSGHIAYVGRRDGAFYLSCNAEDLLRVAPTAEYAEALVVDNTLHHFTPYYCVGRDEGGFHAVLADEPSKPLPVTAESANEEILAAGKSGWVTADGNTVRLYRPYADTAKATVEGRLLCATVTDTNALLVTTDGSTLTLSRFAPKETAPPPTVTQRPVLSSFLLEDVPVLAQHPRFPTGCESVSAVMALQYAGENVSVDDFIDRYLPCVTDGFFTKDGKRYGPDPYEVFVGDPRTSASFGCMSPVIQRAINKHFGTDSHTRDTGGESLEALCQQYVSQGTPVLTWVTIAMLPVVYQTSWYTPNGTQFSWPGNEHCMLLVGYDEEHYYFNDPYRGMRVAYDRALAEERYRSLGSQSLIIVKN